MAATNLAGSRMILDLIGTTRWTGMTQGKASARAWHLRQSREYAPKRAEFLEDCGQMPRDPKASYVHPASTHTAIGYRREAGQEELTPAELVWLQRLPLNPADVTHEDAARLAGMFGSVDRMKSPSSHQLVASIWQPIKELHDRREAEQQVSLLKPGLPPVPRSAQAALVEALEEEHPDWPESAYGTHAAELLAEALDRRQSQHDRAVRQAEGAVEQLTSKATDRVALVRESA